MEASGGNLNLRVQILDINMLEEAFSRKQLVKLGMKTSFWVQARWDLNTNRCKTHVISRISVGFSTCCLFVAHELSKN